MKKEVSRTRVLGWSQVSIGALVLIAGIVGIILLSGLMSTDNANNKNDLYASYQGLSSITGNVSSEVVYLMAQDMGSAYNQKSFLIKHDFITDLEIIIIGMVLALALVTNGLWKVLNEVPKK